MDMECSMRHRDWYRLVNIDFAPWCRRNFSVTISLVWQTVTLLREAGGVRISETAGHEPIDVQVISRPSYIVTSCQCLLNLMPILGSLVPPPVQPLYFKSLLELDKWTPGQAGNRYDGILKFKPRESESSSKNSKGKLLVSFAVH